MFALKGGALTVTGLIDGSAAGAAGVRPNDVITAVDAAPVKVLSVYDVLPKLRGPPGSQVKLTISRNGEAQPFDVIVTRQLIHLDQSESANVLTDRGRAYFAMHDYAHAIADYNRAIQLHPDYADAYYNRAQVKRAEGDAVGGDADNARARQLDPDIGKSASRAMRE